MGEYSEEFLKKTIKVWQPYYGAKILSLQDAKEIADNMVNLVKLSDGLEKKYKDKAD